MINPYDLGNFSLVEHTEKLQIDNLVHKVMLDIKRRVVESEIEVCGIAVSLTTSKTRFNGERLWFQCPICKLRKGTLFRSENGVGCRICLGLKYKKQRFKNMLETSI